MAKIEIIFIVISSLLLIANGRSLEKVTNIRVYAHDIISGPNATVYEVAQANITSTSPFAFGLVRVADNLLTAQPDANSEKLGRVQGFVANTGLDELVVVETYSFIFTAGKYNGSTISVVGWKRATNVNEEQPIVGGTGIFRGAQGYVITNVYSNNPSNNLITLIYDISVRS